MSREFDLDHIFNYHAPDPDQVGKYEEVRNTAKKMAVCLVKNCPPSADLSDAIRKLRECVMTANAAIALDGRIHKEG